MSSTPSQARRPSLLVVEDDAQLRKVLERALKKDFDIVAVESGEAALEALELHLPDVVLSDVMMGGMSGIELLEKLRERDRTLPVVLLTARSDLEGKLDALRRGADDYVLKPFHIDEVRARLRVQLRIRELTRRVVQGEKLAAIGTMVAGVAHEVRNPLNAILSATELLDPWVKEEEPRELMGIVREGAQRLEALTLRLLQHTREGAPRLAPLDVVRSLEQAIRLSEHRSGGLGARALVLLAPEAPLPLVEAEEGALTQLWLNLLDNALHEARSRVEARVEREDAWVHVDIRDDGGGIDPSIRERIFDPFFTTKAVGSGTGLGLSICRETVSHFGGRFQLRETGSEGSVFRVSLRALPEGSPR